MISLDSCKLVFVTLLSGREVSTTGLGINMFLHVILWISPYKPVSNHTNRKKHKITCLYEGHGR